MVQNKDIEEEKVTNGVKDEEALGLKLTNGNHEPEEESDEEDDYLKYLLVVPSLDHSVEDRNMSLISQSLMNFYTTIESRKEYYKIKQELMENHVPSERKEDKIIQEAIDDKLEVNGDIKSKQEELQQLNEVTNEQQHEEEHNIKNFTLQLWKARLGKCTTIAHYNLLLFPHFFSVPEQEPKMFEQFFVCRRCKILIFFKSRKFRKMHNVINHRRKKKVEEGAPEQPSKPKRIRIAGKLKEPLVCDLCSKSFKIKALIRSHMNCHLSEKLHQCTLCNYASKRYNDLRKHHDVHHNPNRVVVKRTRRRRCQECQEIFTDKKTLRTHMRLNHPKERAEKKPRIFKKCDNCEEVLYSKKGYILHIKEKHPEALAIKCEICNRKFKTNFRLKKHQGRYGELLN